MSERRVARNYEDAARLLGRKVRAAREARGFSQDELAGRTGISRNQIQNIEHCRNNTRDPVTGRPGPGNPRLDTIFILAEVLDIDVTYLVDPTQAAPEPEPEPDSEPESPDAPA
ncbi:helix-turn-helix domain-containing protein [Nocardioides sp. LMS-CY]|uniref:helix-turn-helix domain-containing protein n=1 Tax=Nocardioides sp. (strain LMS-CY) TaxID=2840457 RepID=UPI001C000611|nr:helix-turn-helix transcriptional regulator [Nocardioides sp. LMS-CY]QWF24150.1 helix-turn-helix domain-containing protein [Nocardioides sp. LMS-CY]